MIKRNYLLFGFCLILLFSCKKEWLEEKRDIKMIVPATLDDMKLLLQDDDRLSKDHVNFAELSADDYYVPAVRFNTSTPISQNIYTWRSTNLYEGFQSSIADWDEAYYQILVANVILDNLTHINMTPSIEQDWKHVKGSALLLRAKALYNLNMQFAKPYNVATASVDLGMPIKKTPETSEKVFRSTIDQNYELIIHDLISSTELLKDTKEGFTSPTRSSANGLLARIFLATRNYDSAYIYADRYLQVHPELLDFNLLDSNLAFPFDRNNNIEIIQYSEMSSVYAFYASSISRTPDDLYNLYDDNDLRKKMYFRNRTTGEHGIFSFKGSWSGGNELFSGIATDEILLIRAECLARQEQTNEAMADLNTLLSFRWKAGTFTPLSAVDAEEALQIILTERRKELLRRGLRWSDLKRLNQEAGHEITLTRVIEGETFVLPPNDPKYVLPIPEYVIKFNGIEQNER